MHNNNQSLTYTKDYFKKYTLFIRRRKKIIIINFLILSLKSDIVFFFIIFRLNLKEKKMFSLTKGSLKVNNKSKIIINLFF